MDLALRLMVLACRDNKLYRWVLSDMMWSCYSSQAPRRWRYLLHPGASAVDVLTSIFRCLQCTLDSIHYVSHRWTCMPLAYAEDNGCQCRRDVTRPSAGGHLMTSSRAGWHFVTPETACRVPNAPNMHTPPLLEHWNGRRSNALHNGPLMISCQL